MTTREAVMTGRNGAPFDFSELAKKVERRDAQAPPPTSLVQRFFVAADEAPRVEARVTPVEGAEGSFEVMLELEGVKLGARATPPPLRGKGFRKGLPVTSGPERDRLLEAFLPDHLAIDPLPRQLVPARHLVFHDRDKRVKRPTTIFSPDDRRLFRDTSYPWSTVGIVQTPHGTGSGAMIGPRHLLTVSHAIEWRAPAGFAAGWVKFTPSSYDGAEPFGHAYGTHIYWFNRDNGDNSIDQTEEQYDYVVIVLDSRMGETTGWMGARGYTDTWDGLNAWSHMGYPGDLNNGQRPSFQGGFPLDGSAAEPDEHEELEHRADVWPGQSGGPVFGWWDGDVGPRAVGVQSWQSSDVNGASGGGDPDELVIHARTDFA
jgi:V8-like Glu-specific endopeptidase